MYLPEAFAERDPVLLAQFIDAFPLGLLITNELITNELITSDSEHDTQHIVANLLPFEFSAGAAHAGVLRAHIARANPLAQTLAAAAVSAEVLVVFQGPRSHAHDRRRWLAGGADYAPDSAPRVGGCIAMGAP